MKYEIRKSKDSTTDGLYCYNFETIPQNSYIKVHNMLLKNDKRAVDMAIKLLAGDIDVTEARQSIEITQNL